jgi:two-component system, OmpR family, response regulator VicR
MNKDKQRGDHMTDERILIVEDDREIAGLISDYLTDSGFSIKLAPDGRSAIRALDEEDFSLSIIDIMIPEPDGFQLCRHIREISSMPIIIVSAKKDDVDKILGLGLGADDYVTKPFSPRELVARVQSHIRRFRELTGKDDKADPSFRMGDIEINMSEHTVRVRGQEVPFSVKEFELLSFLAHNPNQAISRERIFDRIWGSGETEDLNTVTVHVRKLREKVEVDPSSPRIIETVWGIGYRFRAGSA